VLELRLFTMVFEESCLRRVVS